MSNMMALNTVYNHYLTTYADTAKTKYDTHKKSELRGVYNSIVRLNRESPLFLLPKGSDTSAFAVGIKEAARTMHNSIASLGGLNDSSVLFKKLAFSSNTDIADATYTGSDEDADKAPLLELSVESLASHQVNTGRYLPAESMRLDAGTYSFDLGIGSNNYEFQFNINEDETNLSLQNKLARLVNNSELGIEASVETSEDGSRSALVLRSVSTGTPENGGDIFNISDEFTSYTKGVVDYLGIDNITTKAEDSLFHVNGEAHHSQTNHIILEDVYDISLRGVSPVEGMATRISIKDDADSLYDSVEALVESYNSFLGSTTDEDSGTLRSPKLFSEIKSLSDSYIGELSDLGVSQEPGGTLKLDRDAFLQSVGTSSPQELMSRTTQFTKALVRKTAEITLNPMKYVNKTVVAYKNPAQSFQTPYITSAYSGMMFNSYC